MIYSVAFGCPREKLSHERDTWKSNFRGTHLNEMMKLVSCNARIEGCSAPFTSWIHAHRLDIERWFVKYVSTITVAADYLFESDHGLNQTSGALQDENRPLESWNMRCSSAWAACHSQSPREQFSRCLRQKAFWHSHIHIGDTLLYNRDIKFGTREVEMFGQVH